MRLLRCATAAAVLVIGTSACRAATAGAPASPSLHPASSPAATSAQPSPHPIPPPGTADPAHQWIVDLLTPMRFEITPTTANLIVLTSSGHEDASVVWLVDDQNYCAARVGTGAKGELEGPQGSCGRLADLARDSAAHKPLPMVAYGDLPVDLFEVWMDQPEDIVLVGDDSHVFGPVHQRRIQLTAGHTATIVEYRTNATSDDPHLETGQPRLCTASASLCRSMF